MLYLAEVQKQKAGLLGGSSKTDLKLLACQKNDQSWNTVSEEIINAEEASKLNDGALVLVEINPPRQVQRIQEAGRPLVNILQNFSRQLEKFKLKEEEIDQWKESLTFQAQELNRRELELETGLEQLQQLEENFKNLETQQQELSNSREEIEQLREEIKRHRQELEGAWDHLRGEQRRLEESNLQTQMGLDDQQIQILKDLIDRLSQSVAPCEIVRDYLKEAFEIVENQQAILSPQWEELESQKIIIQQRTELETTKQELFYRLNSSEQIAKLKTEQLSLQCKEEHRLILQEQWEFQQNLYNQICALAGVPQEEIVDQQVEVEILENMPLEELAKIVQDLQSKFDIDFSFVNDQEHELKYKEQTIEELNTKIKQASDSELSQLEAELADEQDVYQMLNKTLEGQRRSLFEQEQLLKKHQSVLLRRQGRTSVNSQSENQIDLTPIIAQIEQQQQQKKQELQNLETEITEIQANIESIQSMMQNESQQIDQQELQKIIDDLLASHAIVAMSQSKVDLYQEAVQPIQNCIDELYQKLSGIDTSLVQVQETGDYQLKTIADMRQVILSLIQLELAA